MVGSRNMLANSLLLCPVVSLLCVAQAPHATNIKTLLCKM